MRIEWFMARREPSGPRQVFTEKLRDSKPMHTQHITRCVEKSPENQESSSMCVNGLEVCLHHALRAIHIDF